MGRKTCPVVDIAKLVNEQNRCSTCSPLIREGWNTLLEEILHDTGNYRGYGYLRSKDVPKGELPGIDGEEGNFTHPDETRRFYIYSMEMSV